MTYVQIGAGISSSIGLMTKGKGQMQFSIAINALTIAIIPMYIYIVCMFSQWEPCPYEVCGDVFVNNV